MNESVRNFNETNPKGPVGQKYVRELMTKFNTTRNIIRKNGFKWFNYLYDNSNTELTFSHGILASDMALYSRVQEIEYRWKSRVLNNFSLKTFDGVIRKRLSQPLFCFKILFKF